MIDKTLFTKEQRDTFEIIQNIEEQLKNTVDPTQFVLNRASKELYDQMEAVRDQCDHIYENHVCVICGKEEE